VSSNNLLPAALKSKSLPIKTMLLCVFEFAMRFDVRVFLALFFKTLVFVGFGRGAGFSAIGAAAFAFLRGFFFADSRDSRALIVGLRTRDEFRMSDALVGLDGPSAVPSDPAAPKYWSLVQPVPPMPSRGSKSELS
jgi:hypothetical protein